VITFFILDSVEGLDFSSFITDSNIFFWAIGGGALLLLMVVYTTVVGFIFEIEKRIWVDSHFDEKSLDQKDSWRIAKALFWPAVVLRVKVALRYYFVPIVGLFVLLALSIYAVFSYYGNTNNVLLGIVIAFILFLITVAIYGYYLKIKLRYVWFIFLDSYGRNYSYQAVIDEMDALNDIRKSETFKKSLIATIGTDSVNAISQVAIGTITQGLSMLGNTGKLVGSLANVYGKETSKQAADLGNIAAQYMLYRFTIKELYGEEQIVNDELYKL
jgi:hypothetical protein